MDYTIRFVGRYWHIFAGNPLPENRDKCHPTDSYVTNMPTLADAIEWCEGADAIMIIGR